MGNVNKCCKLSKRLYEHCNKCDKCNLKNFKHCDLCNECVSNYNIHKNICNEDNKLYKIIRDQETELEDLNIKIHDISLFFKKEIKLLNDKIDNTI